MIDLNAAIEAKRAELQALDGATPGVEQAQDLLTPEELEERSKSLRKELGDLLDTFEQLATAGVDKRVFQSEPAATFDWQAEIVEISRPIFDQMRALTEKPRRIERLRREIELGQNQVEAARRAVTGLERGTPEALGSGAAKRVERLESDWRRRLDDAAQRVEVARLQLDNLLNDEEPLLQRLHLQLSEFARGRGVVLLLALSMAALAWLLMRLAKRMIERRARRSRGGQGMRYRLLIYAHRLITVLVVTAALLITFSVMGDFLLLTVTIIGVTVFVLSLRRVLPEYLAEAKLLLGIGPVREGERLVYGGLPFEVKTINVFCVLRNPLLEGVIRVPLPTLTQLCSRPAKDEPWFPSRPGDYLLLPDDAFACVTRQTLENVELSLLGGIRRLIPNTDYIAMTVRNLSEGGTFAVPVVFGIDYKHQSISLDEVPPKLEMAVEQALRDAPFGGELVKVMVDFKAAGLSSLDYLVAVTMNSAAANFYPAIGRAIQQACVAVCTREGWGIPFAQMTIHRGEGFSEFRTPGESSQSADRHEL